MSSISEQIDAFNIRLNSFQAMIQGMWVSGELYALVGSCVVFGCKITQGYSAADMILAMDGQASGDSAHLNPDGYSPANRPEQYFNSAIVYGGPFFSESKNVSTLQDAALTITTAPGTGYHRYDCVYAYVTSAGPGVAIAAGTPVVNASTPTLPAIPQGTLALAQIHVEANVTGIADAKITDLRDFSGRLQGSSPTINGTSATSNTIPTSFPTSLTFTTQAGIAWLPGQQLDAASTGTPTAIVTGTLLSYSGTTAVISVTAATGSGTHTDWNISLTGLQGLSGYSGISGFSGTSGFSGYSGYSGFSGFSGISGYSGYSGWSGFSGISGFSGYSGYSGANGASGTSGFSGYSGYSGANGASGTSGFSGYSGYSGYSGQNGASGTSGFSGANPGASGYSGYSGATGGAGTSGYSGYSGSNGATGTSGYSGYSGFSGAKGDTGNTGGTGSTGTSGYSGYSGANGSTGTSGYSGYSGANGAAGTSGYSGYSGANGTAGTSGYSGYSGANGTAGTSGYSGYSGVGTSGYSGYSGAVPTSLALATNGQITFAAPTTDGHCTGPTTSAFVSGYTSSAVGELVYLDSSSKWQKTDANTLALYNGMLGIALGVAATDASLLVALPGAMVRATGFPTFTVGSPVYMSETAGAVTHTAPTTTDSATRMVGWGMQADTLYFFPSPDYITHA